LVLTLFSMESKQQDWVNDILSMEKREIRQRRCITFFWIVVSIIILIVSIRLHNGALSKPDCAPGDSPCKEKGGTERQRVLRALLIDSIALLIYFSLWGIIDVLSSCGTSRSDLLQELSTTLELSWSDASDLERWRKFIEKEKEIDKRSNWNRSYILIFAGLAIFTFVLMIWALANGRYSSAVNFAFLGILSMYWCLSYLKYSRREIRDMDAHPSRWVVYISSNGIIYFGSLMQWEAGLQQRHDGCFGSIRSWCNRNFNQVVKYNVAALAEREDGWVLSLGQSRLTSIDQYQFGDLPRMPVPEAQLENLKEFLRERGIAPEAENATELSQAPPPQSQSQSQSQAQEGAVGSEERESGGGAGPGVGAATASSSAVSNSAAGQGGRRGGETSQIGEEVV